MGVELSTHDLTSISLNSDDSRSHSTRTVIQVNRTGGGRGGGGGGGGGGGFDVSFSVASSGRSGGDSDATIAPSSAGGWMPMTPE